MHEREENRRLEAEISEDILGRLERRRVGPVILVLGLLVLLGLVGTVVRLIGGFADRTAWGYYAATFAYLLSTVSAVPIVIAILRFTKADWRRTIARPIEAMSVAGIGVFLMFIPLPFVLPPLVGRANIWFDWPLGAPGFWDGLAVLVMVLTGLAIFYFSLVPDLAAAGGGRRTGLGGIAARLSGYWQGTKRQWLVLQSGLIFLGAFYIMMYVFVHLLISVDFSMSLVPGWRSAIYPAYHAVSGLQGGIATAIIVLALLRRYGGLKRYIGLDQFWGLAKILLALSLLWFYFEWSEFITFWYGRTPREHMVLLLLMFGPYLGVFIASAALCFLVPFLLLIWNRIRVSILGPTLVSAVILVGLFFDRVRLYVSAFSVENPMSFHELEHLPATHLPDLADLLIIAGWLALPALLFVLVLQRVPVMALWEVKEGLRLRVTRRFLRGHVTIIGKPR